MVASHPNGNIIRAAEAQEIAQVVSVEFKAFIDDDLIYWWHEFLFADELDSLTLETFPDKR